MQDILDIADVPVICLAAHGRDQDIERALDLVTADYKVVLMNHLMQGKICLITGGSDGIGYAAARRLARMGARVVIVGRNSAKTEAAVQQIIADTDNPAVEYLLADLSSQREVRRVAAEAMELCLTWMCC